MFCTRCSTYIEDGDCFCKNCGASLQETDGVMQRLPVDTRPGMSSAFKKSGRGVGVRGATKNPYRDQIAQIRLQLKELRMNLRELNNQITGTRSNYFEFDSFVQRGLVHNVGRMIEGTQLFGPYQQRKQLQDQIAQLERQLLPLEKAQEQWRLQREQ